jgi:hypothetical protein
MAIATTITITITAITNPSEKATQGYELYDEGKKPVEYWLCSCCHGTNENSPEGLSALNESSSWLNESDRSLVESSFSVELFVNK